MNYSRYLRNTTLEVVGSDLIERNLIDICSDTLLRYAVQFQNGEGIVKIQPCLNQRRPIY